LKTSEPRGGLVLGLKTILLPKISY
jgi:hypothetical protein